MYRPCVNKLTGAIETLDISTIENPEDYIIVSISNEANWNSVRVDGTPIDQERPTRAIALEQEKAYEAQLIEEAIAPNKKRKSQVVEPVVETPVEAIPEATVETPIIEEVAVETPVETVTE